MQTYAREITDTSLLAEDMLAVLPASLAGWARNTWLKLANKEDDWYHDARNQLKHPVADKWLKDISQSFANSTLPFDISASDGDIIEYGRALAVKFNRFYGEHIQFWTKQNQSDFAVLFTVANQYIDVLHAFIKKKYHHHGVEELAALLAQMPSDLPNKYFKNRLHTPDSIVARLLSGAFWVRKMRCMAARELETIIRNHLGFVHRNNQLYVSNEQVRRRIEQKARNQAMLAMKTIVNELGEEFQLDEVVAGSIANPAVRRAELMVRLAGFEHMAQELGHVCEFITLTCPSRFHVHSAARGRKNGKFDGSTPTEAQAYLNEVWGRIGSHLGREHIKIYGFRVTEPHHDGCPHWHGLFFMPKEHRARFRQIMALHGCREDRRELKLFYQETRKEAKAKARVQWEFHCQQAKANGDKKPTLQSFVDRQKVEADVWKNADYKLFHQVRARVLFKELDLDAGSAVGYIAKYISKNIDGKNNAGDSIGGDYESADYMSAVDAAVRVDAWASAWGIRQFQQFGGAPVSVWRELRRLRISGYEEGDIIERAAAAADKGDWGKFTMLMGGISLSNKDRPIKLYKEDMDGTNAYGEPRAKETQGVYAVATGELLYSRHHVWTMVGQKQAPISAEVLGFEGGVSPAWTRVNNSTNLRNAQKHFTDQLAAAIVAENKENRRHFNKEQISELVAWVMNNNQVLDYESINNAAAVLMYADAMVEMGETALLNKYESFEHFKNTARQEVRIFKQSLKPVDIHIAEYDMARTQVEIDRLKNEIAEIEAQAYAQATDPIERMMRRAGRNIDLSRQGIAVINTKTEEAAPTVAELQAEYIKAQAEKRRRTKSHTLADQLQETRKLIARMQSRTMQ